MPRDMYDGPAVVVGTDGSASATEAVRSAAAEARVRGAALHIVCGFPRTSRSQVLRELQSFQRQIGYSQMGRFELDGFGDDRTIARAVLEDAAHLVSSDGLRVFMHALSADPHRALRCVAKGKQAQLVVVGNKKAATVFAPFRKSVAELLHADPPCRLQVVDTSAWWHAPRYSNVGAIRPAGAA